MTLSAQKPTILWHRLDLRLTDNPALMWASKRGAVIPLYIINNIPNTASSWWLEQALEALSQAYKSKQINLVIKQGEPLVVLQKIIKETQAQAVTWSRSHESSALTQDKEIEAALTKQGLDVATHNSTLLFEPSETLTKTNGVYRVFTPFSRNCLQKADKIAPALQAPQKILAFSKPVSSMSLPKQNFKWASSLQNFWRYTSEQGAQNQLEAFCAKSLENYATHRDSPSIDGTSRLSPYLHFGQISVRQIWHKVQFVRLQYPEKDNGAEVFLRELLWREFSYHLLYHVPTLPQQPLQTAFAAFPWVKNAATQKRWQKGLTGYPLVDAGMRQLWQTGWMHNRVRMVVASFFVKQLLQPWQDGEKWFENTLADADLANNAASWQWVAGCGADAAPFFRIFNPILQSQKFDPDGAYIRTYVPELANLPATYIHAPWERSEAELKEYGVILGKTYPIPMVNNKKARDNALNALKTIKKT